MILHQRYFVLIERQIISSEKLNYACFGLKKNKIVPHPGSTLVLESEKRRLSPSSGRNFESALNFHVISMC